VAEYEVDLEIVSKYPIYDYIWERKLQIAPNRKVQNSIEKIYLLVDHINFSASESFANFMKYTNSATLVGEPTGGDGIGIESLLFHLPNTGFVIKTPFVLGLDPMGQINHVVKTQPDIVVDMHTLNQLVLQKDYQGILDMIEQTD